MESDNFQTFSFHFQSIETQRHLLQTKFKQDEDMGLLTHRLQIDDVDCMTIRNSIEFTTF